MKAEIKDGKLVIEIDANLNPPPSKSGKNLIVASTGGNERTTCMVNGKALVIGLNAYIAAN